MATILASYGLSIQKIGAVLGHDGKTVRKHLASEIDAGVRQFQAEALTRLLTDIQQHEPDGSSARGRRRGSSRSRAPLLEIQDAP